MYTILMNPIGMHLPCECAQELPMFIYFEIDVKPREVDVDIW